MTAKDKQVKASDVQVLKDIKPSDNRKKNDPPPHEELRVTKDDIMKMQNECDPNLLGYKPHKVNGIVPIDMTSGEIKPAADGSIGTALMKPGYKKKVEKKGEKDA